MMLVMTQLLLLINYILKYMGALVLYIHLFILSRLYVHSIIYIQFFSFSIFYIFINVHFGH